MGFESGSVDVLLFYMDLSDFLVLSNKRGKNCVQCLSTFRQDAAARLGREQRNGFQRNSYFSLMSLVLLLFCVRRFCASFSSLSDVEVATATLQLQRMGKD